MRKKVISIVLSLVFILSLSNAVFADNGITVKLDDKQLTFDVPPQIIDGRTMVPMRKIFEELGASVDWNAETRTITSKKGTTTISLTIGVETIAVNNSVKSLDVAPSIIDGRTLVPVRAISEAFNLDVEWESETATVVITQKKKNTEQVWGNLKNIVRKKGDKYKEYYFYIINEEKDDSLHLSYNTEDNCDIIISHEKQDSQMTVTTAILHYVDDTVHVLFTIEDELGEHTIFGNFSEETEEFIVLKSDFPVSLHEPALNLLHSNLALMDINLQMHIGISFEELGMYYNVSQ